MQKKGRLIIVKKYKGSCQKTLRIYLLCNPFAAIIHQRKFIPLHASGFLTANGIVLLIGYSGSGKSTTIKGLEERGYQLFTDDVCVVKEIDGKIYCIPSYPMVKLWENSFNLLELTEIREENRIWPDENKFSIFFHLNFINNWKPLWKIFVIEVDNNTNDDVFLIEQSIIESFKEIGKNTYRNEYIEPMQLNALHFNIVSKIIKQCSIHKITRPRLKNTISEVINLIESHIL